MKHFTHKLRRISWNDLFLFFIRTMFCISKNQAIDEVLKIEEQNLIFAQLFLHEGPY